MPSNLPIREILIAGGVLGAVGIASTIARASAIQPPPGPTPNKGDINIINYQAVQGSGLIVTYTATYQNLRNDINVTFVLQVDVDGIASSVSTVTLGPLQSTLAQSSTTVLVGTHLVTWRALYQGQDIAYPVSQSVTVLPPPTVKSGLLIPMYIAPGPSWDLLTSIKNSNPTMPLIAVMNPFNGPSNSQDPAYVLAVNKAQAAGIKVLGYVATTWAAKSLVNAKAEIDKYVTWYGVSGIFFDEMVNVTGSEAYYSNLTAYVKSKIANGFTVGNPGSIAPVTYIGTVDNLVVYESLGYPNLAPIQTAYGSLSKSNFSILAYGVGTLDTNFVRSAAAVVGYMYITDITGNPWGALASYLSNEALVLASL